MKPHRIALLPGDGIGPDVVAEAVRVLEAVAPSLVYDELPAGAAEYLRPAAVSHLRAPA
jgi:isocitrate/isopropylmalate dehydrogenase